MFGLQSMVNDMLKENGINVEQLKQEVIEGYNKTMQFVEHTTASLNSIAGILKVSLDMQRVNAAKLDAIMSHLNIKLDEEKTDGQESIQFKQQ